MRSLWPCGTHIQLYACLNLITVTLSSSSGDVQYRGLLVQGRRQADMSPVGSFSDFTNTTQPSQCTPAEVWTPSPPSQHSLALLECPWFSSLVSRLSLVPVLIFWSTQNLTPVCLPIMVLCTWQDLPGLSPPSLSGRVQSPTTALLTRPVRYWRGLPLPMELALLSSSGLWWCDIQPVVSICSTHLLQLWWSMKVRLVEEFYFSQFLLVPYPSSFLKKEPGYGTEILQHWVLAKYLTPYSVDVICIPTFQLICKSWEKHLHVVSSGVTLITKKMLDLFGVSLSEQNTAGFHILSWCTKPCM